MRPERYLLVPAALTLLALAVGCVAPAIGQTKAELPPVEIRPPEFPEDPKRDSMPKIIDQALTELKRGKGPKTQMQAIDNVLRALHMSGIVTMPTAGVPETEKMHAEDIAQRRRVIDAFQGHLDGGKPADEIGQMLLDAKAFLEAELDVIQTLGAWTLKHRPGTPAAKELAKHNIRAPFVPYAPLKAPQKDIRTGVIGEGQCFIVLKEIQGIKVRLIAELIPIWIEPWYARRRIVGFEIVWRLEFVPAELVKKLITCRERGKLVHSVDQREVLEPMLLNFWRFYRKDP